MTFPKRILVAGIFLLAVPALYALEIIKVTDYTFPGGIIKVTVDSPHTCEAEFMGKMYPLFKDGKISSGYVPVRLDMSGKAPLIIREKRFLRKDRTTEKMITIQDKKFRQSRISVGRESIPAVPAETKKKIWLNLGSFTKKKYSGDFSEPLKKSVISSGFGVRRVDKRGKTLWQHKGVDFVAPLGTEVFPVSSGKVIQVLKESPIHGNAVIIEHGRGVKSFYMHMDENLCEEGEMITPDRPLGTLGSTGLSTGAHLHLGIYLFGVPVDPIYAIKALRREEM
ncbi:MAG: M23 family metallopeptidase [Elusimicrobiota bacterium]|nr:M23 family metallopeptidase [Elusimicrobiota bacterium]